MSLTVRLLKEYINSLPDSDLDCSVVLPYLGKDALKNVFMFEEACAGVSEMIIIAEAPDMYDDARGENKNEPMRALLIAPHRYHESDFYEQEIKRKEQQN